MVVIRHINGRLKNTILKIGVESNDRFITHGKNKRLNERTENFK